MIPGTVVRMRFTKWGGSLHWHFDMDVLGTDEHGTWFGGRAGAVMQRGSEAPVLQPHDYVCLVPAEGDWIAYWNAPNTFTDVALYIDVTDRPVLGQAGVTAVDLDLDVVRTRDGSVRILDEDEFAEHQVRYRYPPEVIAGALATARQLVARVTARAEPFATVGETWLAAYSTS